MFSIVAFKTLTLYKVEWQHTWGVVGSLVRVLLLQTFSWLREWNKLENRSIFHQVKAYKVNAYKKVCQFLWVTLYSSRLAILSSWQPPCWRLRRWAEQQSPCSAETVSLRAGSASGTGSGQLLTVSHSRRRRQMSDRGLRRSCSEPTATIPAGS